VDRLHFAGTTGLGDGAVEVTERPRPASDGGRPVRDPPPSDRLRRTPRASDLGAPPSYLEVGLWTGRLPAAGDGAGLILNPALRSDGEEIVAPDPATGIEAMFAATGPIPALLARIGADPTEIDRLPGALKERLTALGILLDPGSAATAAAEWKRVVGRAAACFGERRYAELPGVFNPAAVAFLRERYRRMAREAALPYGDPQCPTRWTAHNDEAALPLHSALAPLVSQIVGAPVKPSYLYLGAYAQGSYLARHTDREQCVFTASMLVDYLPDPGGPSLWPLQLHLGDPPVSIQQRLGEILLFAGRDIEHGRPPLPEGHMSVSLFFHFVPADFDGSID